nr:hypothetical protein [Pandoravirus massiliensis]
MQAAPTIESHADGDGARLDAVSLTDALPAEMLCKVVAFFRAWPSQWMALLLTSRAVSAAAHTVLDPASDHVRSGPTARAPTLAARLVAQYAGAVPRVLDAYRCANASAVLVEACRAGNIALMRTLIAERARWRVDVAYRHNRALLECVRLHSAVGVQLLLATGEADPTDYPGAAHVGRCALHDEPACRRVDHPEPCDACARGQQHGPWSDSDTDDEVDGEDYEAYIDIIDHSDPLAETDEDDMDQDPDESSMRRRHHTDDRGNDNDDQRIGAPPHRHALQPDSATVAQTDNHRDDEDDDNHFGVDYDALFEHEAADNDNDNGAGVYGGVFHCASQRDAWSLDEVADDDLVDEGEDDGDYEHEDEHEDGRHGTDGDASDDGIKKALVREPSARVTRARAGSSNMVGATAMCASGSGGTDALSNDPDAHVYASIAREDDNSSDADDRDGHDYAGDEQGDQTAYAATSSSAQAGRPAAGESAANGHALAIRRAHLAQCICRRGMAFAIVWIDGNGREIGGRADSRTADPLWFLVCDDPSALVANGPLSFLMNGGRARDLTPARGAAFVSSHRDTADDDIDHTHDIIADMCVANKDGGGSNEDENDDDGPAAFAGTDNAVGDTTETIDGVDTVSGDHNDDDDDNNNDYGNGDSEANSGRRQGSAGDTTTGNATYAHTPPGIGDHHGPDDRHEDAAHGTPEVVLRTRDTNGPHRALQQVCTCGSQGRAAYSRAMERWCPLFWAALMSVGVLGQLLGHVAAVPPESRRWACRFQDVLAMAASQIIVFSSASRMEALSDVHAAALDLALTSGGIDLAVHGNFLVAFAADRGCSDVVEMLVEYDAVDAGAHGDLALRRALWRYVRLYRPIQGAGARLDPEERLNRMALYGATLIALAAAIGLDTNGMEPADAHMEPIDEGFVRSLARRVYPGLTPNDIGRLRLPPLRPHYPPPFARP